MLKSSSWSDRETVTRLRWTLIGKHCENITHDITQLPNVLANSNRLEVSRDNREEADAHAHPLTEPRPTWSRRTCAVPYIRRLFRHPVRIRSIRLICTFLMSTTGIFVYTSVSPPNADKNHTNVWSLDQLYHASLNKNERWLSETGYWTHPTHPELIDASDRRACIFNPPTHAPAPLPQLPAPLGYHIVCQQWCQEHRYDMYSTEAVFRSHWANQGPNLPPSLTPLVSSVTSRLSLKLFSPAIWSKNLDSDASARAGPYMLDGFKIYFSVFFFFFAFRAALFLFARHPSETRCSILKHSIAPLNESFLLSLL